MAHMADLLAAVLLNNCLINCPWSPDSDNLTLSTALSWQPKVGGCGRKENRLEK